MRIHTLKLLKDLENQVYSYKAKLFPVHTDNEKQAEIESEKWEKVLSLLEEIETTLK